MLQMQMRKFFHWIYRRVCTRPVNLVNYSKSNNLKALLQRSTRQPRFIITQRHDKLLAPTNTTRKFSYPGPKLSITTHQATELKFFEVLQIEQSHADVLMPRCLAFPSPVPTRCKYH